ncbi:MAG: hypothetical protein ABI670_14920 [Chloroflexota bacterium]
MTIESFYTTASQICFTLLGLWWVVVQFKHVEMASQPTRRKMAHAISLHFLLLGTMSLMSLVAVQAAFLWRVTFGIGGLFGIVSVYFLVSSLQATSRNLDLIRVGQWVALPLYGLISVFAIVPELAGLLGLGLSALVVEGILFSLMIFLGVNMAWFLFMEPDEDQTE